MAKYIAHASINENGKIAGGKAGDQTKKEVCIRTMYFKNWGYVLRIKNAKVRKQFANNMIDLAKNEHVGYDQSGRNTLLTQAKKVNFDFSKITTNCECDCSSAITICILGAIYKVLGKAEYEKAYKVLVVSGNCATTSTLRVRLVKLNLITVYSSKTYTAGTSKAVFGDIYVKEGSHVICYIDDGKKVSLTTSTTTSTAKLESAQYKDASLAGTYITTTELNLRYGAGASKTKIVTMPKGKEVKMYGFYTSVSGTKWYLVEYGKYTGFCSSKYLKKK